MTPLVTVIMPARDVAAYVADAVESVLAQTYTNWQLIVIANACTDNTEDIVSRYKDNRIAVIHTDEPGLSNARNIGLANAKGDFICFLDADDVLPPNSLKCRAELLMSDSAVTFADGSMIQYDEALTKIHHSWSPDFTGRPYREMMMLFPRCFCGITWMIRRTPHIQLKFDISYTHLEDRVFFLSIASHGNYAAVSETTYHIRRRHGSLMTKLSALEKAYVRYMKHVKEIGELDGGTLRKQKQLFHHMFFRTYLKNYRVAGALRHLWFMAIARQ